MWDKAKKAYSETGTELRATFMRLGSGDTSVLTRGDRIVIFATTLFMILFFAAIMAASYASGSGDLITGLGTAFKTYYTKLVGVASGLAALCILGGLLWTMVSPSSHSSQTPIAWIKKVLLAYFLILILGGLFGVIETLTSGYGYNSGN